VHHEVSGSKWSTAAAV